MSKGLTDLTVRHLRPREQRYEKPDPGQQGLSVAVFPSGKRSFVVRYRFHGIQRKLTLGDISLAAARKAAADALYQVHLGADPSEQKKAAKTKAVRAKADTVRAICEEYLTREGSKLRTVDDRKAAFERLVYKEIGSLPIDSLKRSQITRLLDLIEDEKGPRMADLVNAYLRKVFNWHASRSDDFRSPIVKTPARHNGAARSRILTDDELRRIWKAASEDKRTFAAFVKFLLLTAARRNEAADMTRAEIDGTDWILPGSRNKTKVDLVRPLSEAALAVLASQPQIDDCPYVFTTGKKNKEGHLSGLSGFSKFKKDFDNTCGVKDWTLHDLRRSARSLMSRAGVPSDHAERALGHVIGGVRGVYDRHEFHVEKKKAFAALAAQIERIIHPADNVTPLRRKR